MSNFWKEDYYREFYDKSLEEREAMVGKIFLSNEPFNETTVSIPVHCDYETTNALYNERFNVFKIWINTKEPTAVFLKAMISSIDDGSYSIEWSPEQVTEYFANIYLIPKIIDYVLNHCHSINGEDFLWYCNNIIKGDKSYD